MKTKLILLCMIALAVSNMAVAQTDSDRNFEVKKQLDVFNSIYKNLDMMYVDTLDAKEVIGTGIKAMLRSLDPYTEYYPEENMKELKEMYTGKFAGIGAIIRYNSQIKRVVIDEPYKDMPADKAGLRKGDIILAIDDSSMVDKNVTYVDYFTPLVTPENGLDDSCSYDGIHPAVNIYDDMERILVDSVRKVLKLKKQDFYTLPSDEADRRKAEADADRKAKNMPMNFKGMVEMMNRMRMR